MTENQKTARVLRFLEGAVHPRVFPLLTQRGFGEAELAEGWELLKKAGTARRAVGPEPTSGSDVSEEVDAAENLWMPVVEASLARHYPELRDRVFLNLSQADGSGALLTLSTLLDRLDALGGDEQGRAALELLARRGLTPEVRGELRALVESFARVPTLPEPDLEELRTQREAAVGEAWAWYLEWSAIARTVVKNRNSLRALGFLDSGSVRSKTPEPPISGFPGAEDEEDEQTLSA